MTGDSLLHCRLDLDPNKIVRVVQPPASRAIGGIQPSRADDGEQDMALADLLAKDAAEVDAQGDRVHVQEHILVTQRFGQPVTDPPDRVATVVATIRNKYARVHLRIPIHCGRRATRSRSGVVAGWL